MCVAIVTLNVRNSSYKLTERQIFSIYKSTCHGENNGVDELECL